MEISSITLFFTVALLLIIIWLTYKLSKFKTNLIWQKQLTSMRKDIADKQRVGIKGKVVETFAPFLEGFPFKASESKFVGDPIDYIVFEGLDERDVKGIHLVEVKDKNSKLSKHQKQIKEIMDSLDTDKVTFREFRFDSESKE